MTKHKQLKMKGVSGWGGKRKGSGRKSQSGMVNHMKREKIDFKKPLHMTLKLRDGLPSLRCDLMFGNLKRCLKKAKDRGLRVIHFSLESNHLHLLIECRDNKTLSLGMKSLGASLGKAIRKFAGGKGAVFKGRYHLHILKTPTEARNGMAYVLLNRAKHWKSIAFVDRYSSGAYFTDWRKLLGRDIGPILSARRGLRKAPPDYLSEAQSWLAREGWRKAS